MNESLNVTLNISNLNSNYLNNTLQTYKEQIAYIIVDLSMKVNVFQFRDIPDILYSIKVWNSVEVCIYADIVD